MATIPSPGTSATVWVVDGDHSLWDALTWVDQLMENLTIKISNLNDIVTACQGYAITNSCTIDFLAIFGHGTSGYQSAGSGKNIDNTGTKSLFYQGIVAPGASHLVGPAESIVSGLNGVLSDGATILLAGCSVGEGDQGTALLTTLSTILNRRAVQAFENKVYWWLGAMIGSLKEADGSAVTTSFSCLSF